MLKTRDALLKDLRNNTISGAEFGRLNAQIMDNFITELVQKHLPNTITLIATGGYGREELCPFSDIDILFLTPDKTEKNIEQKIEETLYKIWDCGIKIGHAVRTINECVTITSQDTKALTTLLDARFISGNQNHFNTLTQTLQKQKKSKAYIKAKLEERDTRHNRFNDTRYVLEPNIKEGKGGLRDYQTLFWITNILRNASTPAALTNLKILTKKEQQRFEKAYNFLLTVRCHLHDIANRAEERLHFDIQPALAERLGYTHRNNAKAVERFMKHYFLVTRDIGDLTRIIIAAIEDEEDQRSALLPQRKKSYDQFETLNGRLTFKKDQKLKDAPINILHFFRTCQTENLDMHPKAIQKITRNIKLIDRDFRQNQDANALFLDILTDSNNAALTLRRMHETGVLERFIPEFRKITALMQFDRYHVFTVDEHTLRAIQILHDIENGTHKNDCPLASTLIHDIKNRRALFVAMLLHDICKGREKKEKGQDHSTLGAELALKLCPRLGLTDQETRLVSWLIFDHLFMSEIAFKRDLEDPKTREDFMFRIHDAERLKLLTILTTADIMAVGPDRWSAWKADLINNLYTHAENYIHGHTPKDTINPSRPAKWDGTGIHIDITQNEDKNATTVGVYTNDQESLFAKLSGALAASGTNIIEARIETLEDNTIADIFTIQNLSGKPITNPHRHTQIKNTIANAINGKLDIQNAIKEQAKPPKKDLIFDIPANFTINNNVSKTQTMLEIYTRDRPGLLFDIASLLSNHDAIITSAKINTYGPKANDIFYLKTKTGEKLSDQKNIQTLEKELRTFIDG